MLWQKNNGNRQEDFLQSQFSIYVKRAVHRRRSRYLERQAKQEYYEISILEIEYVLPEPMDAIRNHVEFAALRRAMQDIKDKEQKIIMAHVVEEKSLVEIAAEMGMTYKAATGLYYRAMGKLRKAMEGEKL